MISSASTAAGDGGSMSLARSNCRRVCARRRTLAVGGDMGHLILADDQRHIPVPTLKGRLVDADRVREILIPAYDVTRHLRHQPGLVLAAVQMPPLALTGVVARTARSSLRTSQLGAGMANMDGHACAGQVDFDLGNLPGRLNAKNLAVELTVVHGAGLESGPAGRLPESTNPRKNGKAHFLHHCLVFSAELTIRMTIHYLFSKHRHA